MVYSVHTSVLRLHSLTPGTLLDSGGYGGYGGGFYPGAAQKAAKRGIVAVDWKTSRFPTPPPESIAHTHVFSLPL